MRPAVCQLLRSSCHRASIVGRPTLQLRPLIRSPCNPTFRQFCSSRTLRFDRNQASSQLSFDDSTIYALSTAPGKAAIAVVRISGPSCVEIYHALCPGKQLPKPRLATIRTLYNPKDTDVLDSEALVLFFPSPRTVTGEDVLELHLHGGPAVVRAVLQAISKCPCSTSSIRYAEPGEFTRRAFLNDRLSLTQVEALGDVLSAQTEQQRKLSVRGAAGKLVKHYEAWRQQLLYARGELEALIDFQEDQHFDESPAVLAVSVAKQVGALVSQIEAHIENAMRGELLRNGIAIALLGAPNAGKSSLLNRVVGREAAIVSTEAGTTRDVVEVGLDIGGYFCRLGDMAGLRSSDAGNNTGAIPTRPESSDGVGRVEEEGIRRAKRRALESDVVIVVLSIDLDSNGQPSLLLPDDVIETTNACEGEVVIIINKVDLIPSHERSIILQEWTANLLAIFEDVDQDRIFPISCKLASSTTEPNPGNIQAFLQGLTSIFQSMTNPLSDTVDDPSLFQESLSASERHRLLLEECRDNLEAFLGQVHAPESIDNEIDIVIAAESLRTAADCLARITGRGEAGDVEEVLGVVFEKFCVGK